MDFLPKWVHTQHTYTHTHILDVFDWDTFIVAFGSMNLIETTTWFVHIFTCKTILCYTAQYLYATIVQIEVFICNVIHVKYTNTIGVIIPILTCLKTLSKLVYVSSMTAWLSFNCRSVNTNVLICLLCSPTLQTFRLRNQLIQFPISKIMFIDSCKYLVKIPDNWKENTLVPNWELHFWC